jgi:SMC interacting uncharacterized protein involved in chromosome segregation
MLFQSRKNTELAPENISSRYKVLEDKYKVIQDQFIQSAVSVKTMHSKFIRYQNKADAWKKELEKCKKEIADLQLELITAHLEIKDLKKKTLEKNNHA